eukprot:8909094-Alexandrium_andersonii.AAC.1
MSASLVGSGDVYKRQPMGLAAALVRARLGSALPARPRGCARDPHGPCDCLLYTSDAADDM